MIDHIDPEMLKRCRNVALIAHPKKGILAVERKTTSRLHSMQQSSLIICAVGRTTKRWINRQVLKWKQNPSANRWRITVTCEDHVANSSMPRGRHKLLFLQMNQTIKKNWKINCYGSDWSQVTTSLFVSIFICWQTDSSDATERPRRDNRRRSVTRTSSRRWPVLQVNLITHVLSEGDVVVALNCSILQPASMFLRWPRPPR